MPITVWTLEIIILHLSVSSYYFAGNFHCRFQCQTTDGTTGEPVSSHKVIVSQRIIPIGSPPKFNLTLDALLEGFSLCQCDYLPGADTNIKCSAVIRRCPILHNFTANVIFNHSLYLSHDPLEKFVPNYHHHLLNFKLAACRHVYYQ